MKKLLLFLVVLFLATATIGQPLTGNKTIPGDYATITAAVTDLNAQGVGAGGVTFLIDPGYTESTTAPITVTATGTLANPVIFQKNGAGTNPIVTRTDAGSNTTTTFGGLGDAVITISTGDYITFDGIDAAASQSTIEYGYFTTKTATDGCKFVTIKNCAVTMTKGTSAFVIGIYLSNAPTTVSSATGVTVTNATGTTENITLTGNTIGNVHAGIYARGYNATYYDNNLVIGADGAGNTIQNYGGGSNTTTYGVFLYYQGSNDVSYNIIDNAGGGGSDHGSTLYGIYYATRGGAGNCSYNFNSITLGQSSTSAAHCIYESTVQTSKTINYNTFSYGTFASTSTTYMIYNSSATNDVTVSGNMTAGTITKTGASGSFYLYYNAGSPTGGTETLSDNVFQSIDVSAGTGILYGIYSNSSTTQSRICSGNWVSDITASSTVYSLYLLSSLTNTISDNTVLNINTAGTVYGLYFTGTNPTVYRNSISGITTSGATLYGIYDAGTGTTNLYNNKVCDLTNNSASPTFYGVYVTTGTSQNIYNNIIGNLFAPSASSVSAIRGIYISSTVALSNINVYYNTVYLNATSTGANFGTIGIYHTTNATATTAALDLRNNIIVNNSTANGTGISVAYQRSSATLTNYASTSNNNDFFAPVTFYDGTSQYLTLDDYKALVSPRDASSISEDPTWVSTACSDATFLHINTTTPTQLESGGQAIATITNDFDGNIRQGSPGYAGSGTAPDIGADEFEGTPLDLTPPTISYTELANTLVTGDRTLEVTITDASGVPQAGIGLPMLYFNVNSGTWTGVQGVYNAISTNYDFTFGGSAVAGDIVRYYVVAQDNATTPNITSFPLTGASGFTPDPPTAGTPPGDPSFYVIIQPICGTKTIDNTIPTGGNNYNSFDDALIALNFHGLCGTVTFNVSAAQTFTKTIPGGAVTYAYAILNIGSAGNTITFQRSGVGPNPLISITGSASTSDIGMFLYGTDYVTFDGIDISDAGTTSSDWLERGYYLQGPANDNCNHVLIQNCTIDLNKDNINSRGIMTNANAPTSSANGNCYNTFMSNTIQDAYNGIYLAGTSTTYPDLNNVVTGNTIQGLGHNIATTVYGLYTTYQTDLMVTGNVITSIAGASTMYGHYCSSVSGDNIVISGNTISNLVGTGSSTMYGLYYSPVAAASAQIWGNTISALDNSYTVYGLYVSSGTTNSIYNNDISGITYSGVSSLITYGLYSGGGTTNNIYNNNIYNIYAPSSTGTPGVRALVFGGGTTANVYYNTVYLDYVSAVAGNSSAALYMTTSPATINLLNNIFVNNCDMTTGTRAVAFYKSSTALTNLGECDNNLYYAGTPAAANLVFYDGTNALQTLPEYQALVIPKETSSVTENPPFVNTTPGLYDLHMSTSTPTFCESGGVPVASVSDDKDGDPRNAVTPDIGSDEFNGLSNFTCSAPVPGNTVASTNNICLGTSVTLSLQNATGGTGVHYQWQSSPDGITYADITGANFPTFTVTPVAPLYYQCVVTCLAGPSTGTSTAVQITFTTSITSTTPGSRCGIGTVQLAASGTGTLSWYTDIIGGTMVGAGSPFTTPVINTTTTYYVGAETGALGNATVGTGSGTLATYPNPFYSLWSNMHIQHLITAADLSAAGLGAGDLTSVALDITSAGTLPMIDFSLKIATTSATDVSTWLSPAFTEVYTNASLMPVVGLNVMTFSSPFYWDGTSNIVMEICHGNAASSSTMSRTCKSDVTSYVSSIKVHVSAAASAATVCANLTTNLASYSSRPTFTFQGQVVCSGARSPVVATVTPAPALTITGSQTICNNAILPLTVTSTLGDFDVYTWSPVTNLFSDAACTIPYVALTNASTVYVRSATGATTEYTCSATNTTTLCANIATATIIVIPAATISATPENICVSGTSTLSITPDTGYGDATFQWQDSPDNSTFSDIAGATTTSFLTPVLTATRYYKVIIKKADASTCAEPAYTLVVNNPQLLTTTPGSRCGTGTVQLEATGNAGSTLNWYSVSTGGTPVGTGSPWITPVLSSTTSYYVAAETGGGSEYVGPLDPTSVGANSSTTATISTYYQIFDVTSPTPILSVDVFPTASVGSAFSIIIQNSAGTQLFTTGSLSTTVTGGNVQTVPINFTVPAGTAYRMGFGVNPGMIRNSAGAVYPYTSTSVSITGNNFGAGYYYYFYNWLISQSCSSPRTEVIATVTPALDLTITIDQSVCPDIITSMSVTSTIGNFESYTWSPVTNLFSDAGCTTPYVALANASTVYFKSSVAGATLYTCTGSDSFFPYCQNIATSTITVNPGVTASGYATPSTVCSGNNSQLLVQALQNTPANASDYVFGYSLGTYTGISGGTVLGTTANDDELFNNSTTGGTSSVTDTGFPIGFDFKFGSQIFDKFAVSSNGYIVLGTGTFTISHDLSTVLSNATVLGFANVISAFDNDLQGQTGSELSFLTTGADGNRILTVQWKGYRPYLNAADNMNFQIQLQEGTNVVRYFYGANTITTTETGQVGLRTVDNTDVHARATATDWSATTLGTNTSTCTMSGTIFPADGAVFSFTPPAVPFTYLWSPTTFIPAGQELTATPLATGVTSTTAYSVNVTGLYGCTATVNNVTVTVSASTTITSQPVSAVKCTGETAEFIVVVDGGNLTYQWRKDLIDIPIGSNPSAGTANLILTGVTDLDEGTYDVVINSCFAQITSNGLSTLTVNPVPTASASNSSPICSGTTLQLTGTTDIGTLFSWTGPNGFISGTQNPTISSTPYAAFGTYYFTATHDGCSSIAATTNVVINATPDLVINPSAPTVLPGAIQQLDIDYSATYNNGPLINSVGTGAGGLDESILWSPLTNYGINMDKDVGYSIADDFVVTGGTWDIGSMDFFGYETLSGLTPSLTGVYVRIWNGDPSVAGSAVVWGDMTTNRMSAVVFANIYRTNAVGGGVDRPIMKITASTSGLFLAPGTYWVEFATTGNAGFTGPWIPPITITGQNTTGNALQWTGGIWQPFTSGSDPLYNQGAPFIVNVTPPSVTWTPITELYTNAGATMPYIFGTPATTVWTKPTATITYTATSTNATSGCTGLQTVLVTVAQLPVVTTASVTNILATSATCGGEVTSDGGGTVSARGVCWSTSLNPTIADPKTSDGSGLGVFSSNISPLVAATSYHVRAYATNEVGTAYGADVPFTTASSIPEFLTLQNVTVTSTECFDATNTITVAGGGTYFIVSGSGFATFIAGVKISFMPGTAVQAPGHMIGKIYTGSWCGAKSPSFPAVVTGQAETTPNSIEQAFFSIYPNPTNGNFTLVQKGEKVYGTVKVEVFSMNGEKVMTDRMVGEKQHEFRSSDLPTGLYFVKVIADDYVETIKLVKTR